MARLEGTRGGGYLVHHFTPSVLELTHNLTSMLFPPCPEPLTITGPTARPECIFAPRRLAKLVWRPLESRAPDLFNFIENFSFDWREYRQLLGDLAGAGGLEAAACRWLLHNQTLQGQEAESRQTHKVKTFSVESAKYSK